MALRLTEASSSLWPPDRKQIPEKQELNYSGFKISKESLLKWHDSSMTFTRHSSGDGAPQGSHCCHGNLLRGEFLGAGMSSGHHVGLQQSSLQVNMVVRQSLVHRC